MGERVPQPQLVVPGGGGEEGELTFDWILPMAGEVLCQAAWAKWVSVETL
jgi:hypothetical protein